MRRQVVVLGVLLAGALALSYVSFTHQTVAVPGDRTEVVSVTAAALDAVRFVDAGSPAPKADAGVSEAPPPRRRVELEARTDALGRWWTVTTTEGEKRHVFTGGRSADRLVEELAPLYAYRVLTQVPEEKMEALGVGQGAASLELVRGGRTWRFAVGGTTWGAERRYLRPEGTQEVWVVDGGPFRLLEKADATLPERELVGLERRDLARVRVAADGRRVEIVQHHRDDRRSAYWARSDTPDRKSELFENWINKVYRLRAEDYVAEARRPEGLEPVVSLEFDGDAARVPVEILRATKDGQTTWYARSGQTRALVRLRPATAGEVAADVAAVLSADG